MCEESDRLSVCAVPSVGVTPMMNRRSLILASTSLAFAFGLLVLPALAAELLGTIKSVDADANKFVVTADAKDVTVTVNDSTVWESAKGKVQKKSPIARLNRRWRRRGSRWHRTRRSWRGRGRGCRCRR